MVPLLEAIRFLRAPTACGPIRLDRFSPFHEDPAGFGMVDVVPLPVYKHLYPTLDPDSLARVAYYFDFSYADGRSADQFARPVIELCHRWQTEPSPGGGLWQLGDNGNDVVLIDDRGPSRRRIELEGWQAAVYLACDRTQGIAELLRLDAIARRDGPRAGRLHQRLCRRPDHARARPDGPEPGRVHARSHGGRRIGGRSAARAQRRRFVGCQPWTTNRPAQSCCWPRPAAAQSTQSG